MVLMEKHSKGGLGALVTVALLVVLLIVSATGCASGTQAASSTSSTSVEAGPMGSAPNGTPSGTPPAGGPGRNTSSTQAGSTDAVSTTTTSEAAGSTTTTEAATTSTSLDDEQYGDGIYKAGTDISTGLYKGETVSDTGHWEISGDANGAKYVASGDPTGPFYVKVTYGQFLKLNGVIIEETDGTAEDDLASKDLTDGTYRAGYDIEVGWYKGAVTGDATMGYWQISSDANGQKLVANDYPMDSFTLKVTKGQFLTLRGVTLSLQE